MKLSYKYPDVFDTGAELRITREIMGISQGRLSELTGLAQHVLSAFELNKASLDKCALEKIKSVFLDSENLHKVADRKKRYQKPVYDEVLLDPERVAKAAETAGNAVYLEVLKALEIKQPVKHTAIALFSGIGGFCLGFRSCGFDIKGFIEINDGLALNYQLNFPDAKRLGSDIRQVGNTELIEFRMHAGEIDVVIGGPPCQGFSLSGKRNMNASGNYLFRDYLRIMDIIAPKFAIMENVRALASMKSKNGGLVRDEIIAGFQRHGYRATMFQINARDYGVPQHRERVFFMAVRNDIDIKPTFPLTSAAHLSFGDACSDLEFLESGHFSNTDLMHRAGKHPRHVIEWLWNVPEGCSAHENNAPEMRPPSGWNTTYKRQIWLQPGSTVQTTFGMISGCRNVHPIATRALTVREACRLQSFPDSYELQGSLGLVRTGVGNAVPPVLARAIGLHLKSILALSELK